MSRGWKTLMLMTVMSLAARAEEAGTRLTLDGVACRYPARATRLAGEPGAAGRGAWAVAFVCENLTSRARPAFDPPRLSLVNAAGREFPADAAATEQDRAGVADLPPGGRFNGTAVFHPPPDAPAGPWQLQVRSPGRSILLSLNPPP